MILFLFGDFCSLKRNLPIRVKGSTMWAIGIATVGLGMWRMMYGIRKLKQVVKCYFHIFSEMDQERCDVRITLAPYLQAEEDIRQGFNKLE